MDLLSINLWKAELSGKLAEILPGETGAASLAVLVDPFEAN